MSRHPVGFIGPNAVTRVAQAMRERYGDSATRSLFAEAGLLTALDDPPSAPVDERTVRALHQSLLRAPNGVDARYVAREAGRLTGDYLLANRIPKFAQYILKQLPARVAEPLLLQAVARHAWTFAGSGSFRFKVGSPTVVEIQNNPVCQGLQAEHPICSFHAATFERLWRALIEPSTNVSEVRCCACGESGCTFEIRLGDHARKPRGLRGMHG